MLTLEIRKGLKPVIKLHTLRKQKKNKHNTSRREEIKKNNKSQTKQEEKRKNQWNTKLGL